MDRILYRIYTEDKDRAFIVSTVNARFDSFTIIDSRGVWIDETEESIIIEVIGSILDWSKIKEIANKIKLDNDQQAVLISRQNIDVELI